MKRVLKFSAIFLSGFVLSGVIIGYFSVYYSRQTCSQMLKDSTLLAVSNDISVLELFRNKKADRFFETIEAGIPEFVLTIDQNEEMKKSYGKRVLENAKSFYLCTGTPIPTKIDKIIANVKLSPDFACDPK